MLQIINAALVSQGLDEAVSANDGSPEYNLCARNWPMVVEAELEEGLYNFTKQEAALNNRSDGLFGYVDSYIIPGDALHVRKVWTEATDGTRTWVEAWTQDGESIHVNEDEGIYIEYMKSEDPSLWSAAFSKGVQLRMEAIIRRAVWEEPAEARMLEGMADNEFERARVISSRSRSPTEPYRKNRFSSARFLRG